MPKPANHYYHVEMELSGFQEKVLNVKMPIWAPGSYLAREFAKNVNLVKAFDENGDQLPVKKTNKNTWRIDKGEATNVHVAYEVYAFELTVRTSFLDLTHGFVSGSGVFMYVEGHKSNNGSVTVYPYKDFSVVTTALKATDEGVAAYGYEKFVFKDYDQLVDCPIEIGNQKAFSFRAAGVNHKVAVYGSGNYEINQLKAGMKKVVEGATVIFGQNPNEEYTFIIHNVVNGQGGLEHVNSTVLSVNRWTYEGADFKKFLKLVENTITRYSNGGILTGDQVELGSDYKSIPDYKNLTDDIKQHIEELFSDDDTVIVVNIQTKMPSKAPGNADNRGTEFVATIARMIDSGRYDNQNKISLPLNN